MRLLGIYAQAVDCSEEARARLRALVDGEKWQGEGNSAAAAASEAGTLEADLAA